MTIRETCRNCGCTSMSDVLSLGDIVPVEFVKPGDPVRPAAPLTLCECGKCSLVQLRHALDRDTLFRQYWYLSGINPSMVAALRDVVKGIQARVTLEEDDTVIDIGANDGTLIDLFDESLNKIGFDPALNLASSARQSCDMFVNDYFETADVELPKAKVITSIAMFYDLDDPNTFVRKIAQTLRSDGVWVMQMTDLVRMLRANAFDNVCHEHVCYYPLAVFRAMVENWDLEVFDVEFNDVNGASIRCYVGHVDQHEVSPRVHEALADEGNYLASGGMSVFALNVEKAKRIVVGKIRGLRSAGGVVHALGASTKGNTLLQYFGLGPREIFAAAEVNPEKFGLIMAGSLVPIVSQHESLIANPDYYLVLPWHFIDFFVDRHKDYLRSGGALIVPLPVPMEYTLETDEHGHEVVHSEVLREL